MITYLLKSAACLALLLCFYHLVLEREKMHRFNRFFLLGSVLFSFLAPAFVIYVEAIPIVLETTQTVQEYYPVEITTTETFIEEPFDYSTLFTGIYIFISGIFTVRFLSNLWKINKKINQNEKVKLENATLVLVDDDILPHSFWKSIFINKTAYKNNTLEPELLTHELTHVTQKHTIDILILELLQIVFWINPLFIFLKKAIQLNHEFLADNTVIKTHKNTFHYQHLLLNKAAWKNEYYLASNLNYSLTKKRLKMMTTQNSKTTVLLKKLAILPLLAGFIFLFAERIEAQEKDEIIEVIEEDVPFKKIDITELEVYKEYYYRNLTIQRKNKNGKYISKKYNELSKEEKSRLIPPPPLNSKKKVPTKKLIEDLKDNKKYAIWIDGKVMKNSVLDNYKNTDFSNHSVSFVYKNARSKRFPQLYQASLYTNEYFKNENKKNKEKFLEYLKKEYQIEEIIEEKPKKKYIDSPIPTNKSSKQSIPYMTTSIKNEEKKDGGSITDIRLKLKDVNALKITYSNNDSIKFNKGWFITIEEQRYYYTFDKNERIARYYKNGKLANLNIVKEYKKKHKIFEDLKNDGKHYVFKTENEKKEIDREFSDLGGMYFRMPRADKNKVPFPQNPIKPYLRLRKNNKVFYKLRSELTEADKLLIPPPPIPNTATKAQKEKYKRALEEWKKRTGNNFDTPPPPPKRTNKKSSKQSIASESVFNSIKLFDSKNGDYEKKFKKYEALRYQKPHFIKKSAKDKKLMNDLWLELRQQYLFSLSKEDKIKYQLPTSPFLPYMKVLSDGKSYYKVFNQLTKEEKQTMIAIPPNSTINHTLDLLDANDPTVIPIGNYKISSKQTKNNKKSDRKKIVIAISKNGKYSISKDETFKNFETVTLASIEKLISNLSKKDIKNTFVFAKSSDFKKFRSKPSNAKEYQDDIEINLIKSKVKFTTIKDKNGKYFEYPVIQNILDNKNVENVKPFVDKIAEIFKKHNISNITI